MPLVESGIILALVPWVEATLTNFGNALYPSPLKFRLTSLIGPISVFEVVEYSKVFVLSEVYSKFSGLLVNLISNVVVPTPTIE